jgi:Mrp family chromosome partitioning ATPase
MPKFYDALKAAEQEKAETPAASSPPFFSSGAKSQALREKLKGVYHAVESTLPNQTSRIVAFVAANPKEGVSTLLREFARLVSLDMGKRVVLLDADGGFGRHYEAFKVKPAATIEDVLASKAALDDALTHVFDGALHIGKICAAGSLAAVIGSANFAKLLMQLRENYDLVLLDTPPLSESSDALLLTKHSDGFVVVIQAESTRWQVAEGMCDRLAQQGGKLLGVVLNKRRYYIPGFLYKRL